MSEFRTIPPKLTATEWNALLDHGLVDTVSYKIRKNGSYYEAINGNTGKIDYGGANNAGGADGTDASQVIQYAINASAAGSKIVLKNGVYEITSTITIEGKNSIVLEGESLNAILKQKDGTNLDQLVLILNSHNVIIRNLSVDGNRANNTKGDGIVADGQSYRGIIEKVQVWNCYTGIRIDYVTVLWSVINCHVENCYETGIAVINRETTIWSAKANIRGNKVVKTGHHGILISGASDCIVAENHCYDIGVLRTDGFAHGIALDGDGGARPSYNNKVIGNWIYNTRMCGTEVADQQNWVEIIGNHIDSAKARGIYFGGGLAPSYQAVISDNICCNGDGNGIEVNSPNSTELSAHVIIENNICFDNAGDGVFIGWSYCVKVVNNILFNNDKDNTGNAGIRLSECTNTEIIGNILYDNRDTPQQDYGINICSDTYGIIRIFDNKIGTHQYGAINLAGTGTRVIKRNEGFVTENSGTATIPSGQTSVTVPHGLVDTPTIVFIEVNHDELKNYKITNKTSTQFTVEVPNAVTADRTFSWRAWYEP